MLRYLEGIPVRFPDRIRYHLVAARYGQTPEQVRAWPADDYLDACAFLAITGGPHGR